MAAATDARALVRNAVHPSPPSAAVVATAGLLALPMLLLAGLRLVPALDLSFASTPFHEVAIGVGSAVMAFLGLLVLGSFLTTGRRESLALATGLLGFAAVYLWHGIFTGDEHPFNFLIYGPAARLVFAAPLIALARPTVLAPAQRPRLAGAVIVAALGLGLLSFALHHPIDFVATTWSPTWLLTMRIGIETLALLCGLWAFGRMLAARHAGRDIPLVLMAGVALIIEQSAAFIVSSAWLLSWWEAHLLGATASVVLTWSVVITIGDAERRATQLTEQVRIVESAERRAAAILDATTEAMVMVTPQGTLAMANRRFGELLGRSADELVEQPVARLGPQLDRLFGSAAVLTPPANGQAGGTSGIDIDIVEQRWPQRREFERFRTAVRGRDGALLGTLIALRDVTRERELDRMKSEFVGMVSHELRTPMTSIRGALGMLGQGALGQLNDRGQRMLEVAVTNTDRLLRLINDVLDLEKMDSGQVDLERRPTACAELVRQAVEVMQPMAQNAQVTLVAEPTPTPLSVDPDRVLQVLTNLLSNAIKFSPPGGTVRLVAEERPTELRIAVQDQGRGIPQDRLASIFERFHQVDPAESRRKGGTGLGLAISKTIVEQHGGRIWAESAPGHGATFVIVLPRPAEQIEHAA